ncbi:MAG: porin [Rhodobacteraceae bacterium]|nr:porin [Paracoccaceae bacterium]
MKKILLASTALVLSAGLAHAQAVTITGEGRMGVLYESWNNGGSDWVQENRLTLNFNVSVEADHGLTFGAWTRARTQSSLLTGGLFTGVFSGSRVWVQANNLRLTFGNVDGAIRGAGVSHGYAGGCGVGYVGGHTCADTAGLVGTFSFGIPGTGVPGVIAGGASQGQSSTGAGPASRVRVDYTMGDTRIAVSHDRAGATEVGVRTTFNAFTVAAGYTSNGGASWGGNSVWTISGRYNGGSWGVGALVVSGGGVTNYSISGNVAVGGGSLYAYIARLNYIGAGVNALGVSYGYGLGGGATLTAGLERLTGAGDVVTTASVGVAFNF